MKAGDKAILYHGESQQDVVDVLEMKDCGITRIRMSNGDYETVTPYDLVPAFVVEILPDGKAKTVNKVSLREMHLGELKSLPEWQKEINEAESDRIELLYGCDPKTIDIIGHKWYAYRADLNGDTFVLVAPVDKKAE